ncbi:uncharacterized protein DDB_G0286299-like [Lingula anatina]|uniref:Uncharacterized protein DDB_G0286299-like n=1 Tax=Lingula anatina TaxID=7574 RepID=A0A1S3HKK0_LINAN|nr:uncharacterized protein DDB_G0286299-like [Lingula anatina]|eukprot:XP_013385539.2 uncharacterized protein DDB_G0286299-like [Lingula anatina]
MCIMARAITSHVSAFKTFHRGSEEIPYYPHIKCEPNAGVELAQVALWAMSREEAQHVRPDSEPSSPTVWQGGWQDLESSNNSRSSHDVKSEEYDEDGEDSKSESLESAGNSDEEWKPTTEDRRKRRREQNKIAARKCREKKRKQALQTKKETEQLESRNAELRRKIRELESKKKLLLELCSRKMKTQMNSPKKLWRRQSQLANNDAS